MPAYLGLDISARQAHFAITGDGSSFESGTVTLRQLPQLIELHQVAAVACEYTGRLGDQWTLSAAESGCSAFFIHTVERRAINRLTGASVKTDKRDAQSIAQMLYLHADPERRALLGLAEHLFTDAASVRNAWQLRAMCSSVDQLVAQRKAAKQRVDAAARSGMAAVAEQWGELARSKAADVAGMAMEEFAAGVFPAELTLLQSVPGIGRRVSCYLLAQLMPWERFDGQKATRSYAGMHPRLAQSGEVVERARMSKRGNPQLRGHLYTAAMCQTEADSRVGRFYRRLVERGMPKQKAMIAASIKLLCIARAVLASGTSYFDPEAAPRPAQEPKAAMPAGFITQAEAARLIGTSRQRVGQLVEKGELISQPWRSTRVVDLASAQEAAERKAKKWAAVNRALDGPVRSLPDKKESCETPPLSREVSLAERGAEAADDPGPAAAEPPQLPTPDVAAAVPIGADVAGETGRQRDRRIAQARRVQADAQQRCARRGGARQGELTNTGEIVFCEL